MTLIATAPSDGQDGFGGSFVNWLEYLGIKSEETTPRAMQAFKDAYQTQVVVPDRRKSQTLAAELSVDEGRDDDNDVTPFMAWLADLGLEDEELSDAANEVLRKAYQAEQDANCAHGGRTMNGAAQHRRWMKAQILKSRAEFVAKTKEGN